MLSANVNSMSINLALGGEAELSFAAHLSRAGSLKAKSRTHTHAWVERKTTTPTLVANSNAFRRKQALASYPRPLQWIADECVGDSHTLPYVYSITAQRVDFAFHLLNWFCSYSPREGFAHLKFIHRRPPPWQMNRNYSSNSQVGI